MNKFLFFLLVDVLVINAAPVDLWFAKANTFYEQQAYDSAAAYYEKTIESGLHNSALYFNLGNAYFRLSRLGPAILYYEKAIKLSPNDPDIQNNLKFANLNIVDRTPVPERSFLENVFGRLHTLLSLNTQLWVLFILLTVLAGMFCLGLFSSRNVRLWLIYAGSLILLVWVAVGISAGIKMYQEEQVHYAVVLAASADARNQPDGNKVLFSVHEGTKFLIRKESGAWALVSLPNGVSGWVESNVLGKI